MSDKIVNHFVLADGSVARYDYDGLVGAPDVSLYVEKDGFEQVTPQNIEGVNVYGGNVFPNATELLSTSEGSYGQTGYVALASATGYVYIQRSASYRSFLVKIKKGATYTSNSMIRYVALLSDYNESGSSPVLYGNLTGSSLIQSVRTFDTGNAEYAIISISTSVYDTFILSRGASATTDETIILPEWMTGGDKTAFSDVSGNVGISDLLTLPNAKTELKKNERLVFEGNITSFESAIIGWSKTGGTTASDLCNYFVIDNTNISYYYTSTTTPTVLQHGLTFSGNIQIIIEVKDFNAKSKLTLLTDGQMFTFEFWFNRDTQAQPIFVAENCSLTECKFTWTCLDLVKDIWLFGDSYFTNDTVRWMYYLNTYGYAENALVDGYAGGRGLISIVAFDNLLKHHSPKFAVWCLGMNDGSDSSSAPATNWNTAKGYFLALCEQNGVTPILATIPTVPSINHENKNEWIRNSGYRYIDFAKAVGADSSGTWFTGMLSSDNVHPTGQGARALFARVLLDFPEIMIED